jgi:xanthine dehydrogenase accessory factor
VNLSFCQAIRDAMGAGKPFAMVTVVACRGSSPQKPGAKMLVFADGRIHGTVGGGAIEHRIIADAREALTTGAARLHEYELKDLNMMCGGHMDAYIEPVQVPWRVAVFGAGHVCRCLAPMLARLDFNVTVVDDRPEWADPAAFPEAVTVKCCSIEQAVKDFGEDVTGLSVLVMTRGHGLDYAALKPFAGRGVRYLGVMASRKKAVEMRDKLAADGFAPEAISQVRMPIGISIGSTTPEEIAVSIAAELISVRKGAASCG